MLPRQKKAISDMKAQRRLEEAQARYATTRKALDKVQKQIAAAKSRLATAEGLLRQ